MYTTYKFNNWKVSFSEGITHSLLEITCTLNGDKISRVYDILEDIHAIEFYKEYFVLYYKPSNSTAGEYYHGKFEGESGLVIDIYEGDDEFKDTFGAHDFWDDVTI